MLKDTRWDRPPKQQRSPRQKDHRWGNLATMVVGTYVTAIGVLGIAITAGLDTYTWDDRWVIAILYASGGIWLTIRGLR